MSTSGTPKVCQSSARQHRTSASLSLFPSQESIKPKAFLHFGIKEMAWTTTMLFLSSTPFHSPGCSFNHLLTYSFNSSVSSKFHLLLLSHTLRSSSFSLDHTLFVSLSLSSKITHNVCSPPPPPPILSPSLSLFHSFSVGGRVAASLRYVTQGLPPQTVSPSASLHPSSWSLKHRKEAGREGKKERRREGREG